MSEFTPALAMSGVALALVGAGYGAARLLGPGGAPVASPPFGGGLPPVEHAVGRYHARWYPLSMVFLAFDMEMVYMYPWARVVSTVGVTAVAEMFLFLAILLAGVAYAWREGALRWT